MIKTGLAVLLLCGMAVGQTSVSQEAANKLIQERHDTAVAKAEALLREEIALVQRIQKIEKDLDKLDNGEDVTLDPLPLCNTSSFWTTTPTSGNGTLTYIPNGK